MVMDRLRELDPVAYVRFASVYRRFEDVDAFVKELHRLNRSQFAVRGLQRREDVRFRSCQPRTVDPPTNRWNVPLHEMRLRVPLES